MIYSHGWGDLLKKEKKKITAAHFSEAYHAMVYKNKAIKYIKSIP